MKGTVIPVDMSSEQLFVIRASILARFVWGWGKLVLEDLPFSESALQQAAIVPGFYVSQGLSKTFPKFFRSWI